MKQTRNTIAKTKIWNVLRNSDTALSHAELQSLLGDLCDRVTIYRVLDRLVEEGLAHRVASLEGGMKYAACRQCDEEHFHNHLHFSCVRCKSVTCLDDVHPSFKLPEGYKIHDVNFTVSGLCPNCS